MKLTPSVNKTERGSWNNFNSDVLDKFVKDFHPDFVDSDHESYWKNCEDTAVFTMPVKISWDVVRAFENLYANEFNFITINKNKVLIRLWWD
jgi:hypothetical protein